MLDTKMKIGPLIHCLVFTACGALFGTQVSAAASVSCVLNYREPARQWASQALPLGNGRMGCMLFGGVAEERIQFNEQSLWSGDNNWDGNYDTGDHGFGAYRNFGDLVITWDTGKTNLDSTADPGQGDAQGSGASLPADYRRELNIATGIHTTSSPERV